MGGEEYVANDGTSVVCNSLSGSVGAISKGYVGFGSRRFDIMIPFKF